MPNKIKGYATQIIRYVSVSRCTIFHDKFARNIVPVPEAICSEVSNSHVNQAGTCPTSTSSNVLGSQVLPELQLYLRTQKSFHTHCLDWIKDFEYSVEALIYRPDQTSPRRCHQLVAKRIKLITLSKKASYVP